MQLSRADHLENHEQPRAAVCSQETPEEVEGLLDARWARFLHSQARLREDFCARLYRCSRLRGGGENAVVSVERDPQALELDHLRVAKWHGNNPRVAPVYAGNERKRQAQVFDEPGHGPDLPQRIQCSARRWNMARPGYSSGGRLDAGDAAEVTGQTDASSRVAP